MRSHPTSWVDDLYASTPAGAPQGPLASLVVSTLGFCVFRGRGTKTRAGGSRCRARWLMLALFASGTAHAADEDIRLATIGYLPERPKVASVLGTTGDAFEIKSAKDDSSVFEGKLSASASEDPETSDRLRFADFSELREPGEYYLAIEGVGRSLDFRIATDVYAEQFVTAMLGFYGWRSGVAVEFSHRGQVFKQGPGHLQDGLLDYWGQPGVVRDGSHGWYDAGDYGKYTVNGAFTVGMMLQAWEMFSPRLESVALPIPERGGKMPDYLDEIRWEFDWLATMQYSDIDGRVSHKLTSLEFAEFIKPEEDLTATYYSPHGSEAAADFVAAMAIGARVYRSYDEALAEQWLKAAQLSFKWLSDNPADLKPDLSDFETGAYTTSDPDDRLWAAAEYWETTGDASALSSFESRVTRGRPVVASDFDWGSLSNMGIYTYLLSKRSGRSATVVSSLQSKLLECADTLVANHDASGYGRALTEHYWGVNGSVARTCMLLQVANRLKPDERYVNTCADQIAHLYGRNTYNRSYVTGEGKDPPLHPHHRASASDDVERPFPGLLVGGPSSNGKEWVDDQQDYEVNEVAVNWNGALVFALAGFVPQGWSPPQSSAGASQGGAGGSDAGSADRGGFAGNAGGASSSARTSSEQAAGGTSTKATGSGGGAARSAIGSSSSGSGNASTAERSASSDTSDGTANSPTAASGDSEASGCKCSVDANLRLAGTRRLAWLAFALACLRRPKQNPRRRKPVE